MKKLLTASVAAATIAGFATPAAAVEGLSANAGFVSEYVYRGMSLGDAGAYAGIDYEIGGFYVGSWIIDDGGSASCDYDSVADETECSSGNDGLETDFYLGYGMSIAEDFAFNVGVTSYQYSYTSDHENELNLGFGFPMGFALDVAVGEDIDSAGNADDVETDYTFVAASWGGEVFGATLGYYKNDGDKDDGAAEIEYKYFEVSAGGEIAGLDMGVSYGRVFGAEETDLATKVSTEYASDGTDYIVLDISKSFDL